MDVLRAIAAAGLAATVLVSSQALGQQSSNTQSGKSDPLRPRESTANLPSDTGSQTTLPSGAVTGAGHPHGKGKQPDVGSPGGLEPRAREEAREQMRGTGASTSSGGGTARGNTPAHDNRKHDGKNATPR